MKSSHPAHWRPRRLGQVAKILFSSVDKKVATAETPVSLCNYTDVYRNRRITRDIAFTQGSATPREVATFHLREGDVLITKDSEDPRDIAVPALVMETMPDVLCGYHLAVVRPDPSVLDGGFLAELLQHQPTRNYFARLANGATRFGLSASSLTKAPLLLPPVDEQRQIASALYRWDEAVVRTTQLLKLKRREKRGLMQQLLSGHRRFPEFKSTPWRKVQIGEVLRPVNRTVRLDPATTYRLVSIRRRSGGFFDREVRLGSRIGYPSLERLCTGDFVIARRQVVHGAMALVPPQFDGAFVSNAYAVLVPHDPETFHLPFFNYMSQLPSLYHAAFRCSYGVAIEKMFFRLDWFLRESLLIPPTKAEQQKVASVLSAADQQIVLLEQQLEALREQKKGVMQKLLSGNVRVSALQTGGVEPAPQSLRRRA